MAANSPSATVLATPELLDIILLSMDNPLDLIVLQRVCHRFKYHIGSNKILRKRLFFDSDASVLINDNNVNRDESNMDERRLDLNPFVNHLFRSPTDRVTTNMDGESIHERWSLEEQMSRWQNHHFILAHLPRNSSPGSPNASWRSMNLTQPPIHSAAVFMGAGRYPGDPCPRSPDYKIVANEHGVKLGDIFDNIWERAKTPWLVEAPLAVAVLQLASYERIYSACYHAFLRFRPSIPS